MQLQEEAEFKDKAKCSPQADPTKHFTILEDYKSIDQRFKTA